MTSRNRNRKTANAYAIIIAGGNGERLWPMSTPRRPKQFVDIFGGKPLIRHAVDRIEGLIPPERILVITAKRLLPRTRKALPQVPRSNIIGEPCRRDTAAAVAVACGLVKRLGGNDAIGCILTADQLMEPIESFQQTLADTIRVAAKSDAIVTMGISPTYPATGFGYIEVGPRVEFGTRTIFHSVRRFIEKPNERLARKYKDSGCFYWNSGMFIWKASVLERAFMVNAPEIGRLIDAVATARSVPAVLRRIYPLVPRISVDYAVMEKTGRILVAKSLFSWDDVGSWLSLSNHFAKDVQGNTCLGRHLLLDVKDSVVVSSERHLTAVLGLKDVVVVHTDRATLVCAKGRAQELKRIMDNEFVKMVK